MSLKIPGNNKDQVNQVFRLGDFTPELVGQVAEHVASEVYSTGSLASMRDLMNLGKASKFTRAATHATPDLRDLNGRIRRIGRINTLAKKTFDAAAAEGRFPQNQPEDSVRETVDRLGQLLHAQSGGRRRNFAESVLEIQNESVKNIAITQSVKYFESLDAKYRSPLIHKSIQIYVKTLQPNKDPMVAQENIVNHRVAREAIVNAYGFMEKDHHTALQNGLLEQNDREDLGLTLSRELRADRGDRTDAQVSPVEIPGDREISNAHRELRRVLRDTDPHSFERMDELQSVSDFAARHSKSPRQALMNSDRSRDSAGRQS